MALTKNDIMDLMVEEKQIGLTLENATATRETAKKLAEQSYVAALSAASDAYLAQTQKAESRLITIRETLTRDGEWTEPKQASPLGPVMG